MTTAELPDGDDGLPTPEIGAHCKQKYHYLKRYIDAFTTSMSKQPCWKELHYIDLYAGSGRGQLPNGSYEWGSPVIAAIDNPGFTKLHLNEIDPEKHNALRERIRALKPPNPPQILNLDAHEAVDFILEDIPRRDVLSLAFIDPYSLGGMNFSILQRIAHRKADLILFFPDHLDALRNWSTYYMDRDQDKLTNFLGTDSWKGLLSNTPSSRHAEELLKILTSQLRAIGYKHTESQRINRIGDHRELYKLVFFSKHELGAKLWRNVSKKDNYGQMRFS